MKNMTAKICALAGADAHEDYVVLYKVERGERADLPIKGEGRTYGKKVNVPLGDWSALRVTAQGKRFTVYFNDQFTSAQKAAAELKA
jgi:hypothetical protein